MIGVEDGSFALGGDTSSAVRAMLARDASVPGVELYKTPAIRLRANRVRGGVAGWLLHELTPPRDAETSIVCLPYGGGNAVNTMIGAKLSGVDFMVANTDAQSLEASQAPVRIQLGDQVTKGLGGQLAWPGLLRKLDRHDPSYRN